MARVYRLLKLAREQGDIPWEWIVDETRSIERTATWADHRRLRPLRRNELSPRLLEPAARPLDAMDPDDLRDCVEEAIKELIEPEAWERCDAINKAEQEFLRGILSKWRG